ncbi:hypothetical protein [Micromonospora sp. NPDC002717]|uniref:hypothetical protein n=1 Tax=Micromonospora sp. NPDC002717 TaxID=3154424 RepID=UPI00332712C2
MTEIVESCAAADRRFSEQPAASSVRALPLSPWPALVTLLASAGVLNVVLWDVPGILRAVVVLGYLAVAPGLAFARLIRIPDGPSRFVVGVALSLALGVLVAQGMIHLHRWSPPLGLAVVTAIASLAALIELARCGLQHRRRRRMEAE